MVLSKQWLTILLVLSAMITGCAVTETSRSAVAVSASRAAVSLSRPLPTPQRTPFVAVVATPAPLAVATLAPIAPLALNNEAGYIFSQKDIDALILNAFNEARGESEAGIEAVLGVTMARVESACYPDTVYAVVYQSKQFSWTWLRGSARTLAAAKAREPASYARIRAVVAEFIADGAQPSDAVLYHTRSVRPAWAKAAVVTRVKVTGQHIFYENRQC